MTCRIGLPLPFYKMICRGNQLFDLFSTCMESPFGWVTFFPIPSLLSSTFVFWDIRRNLSTLVFTFVSNKMAVLLSFTVIYKGRHIRLLKQQARSRKYFTRETGYVSRDLCITCCAGNVRINNSRHRP